MIGKLIAQVILIALGLIPTWFFLWMNWYTSPDGFWARLIMVGFLIVLGFIQLCFVALLVYLSPAIWKDPPKEALGN